MEIKVIAQLYAIAARGIYKALRQNKPKLAEELAKTMAACVLEDYVAERCKKIGMPSPN